MPEDSDRQQIESLAALVHAIYNAELERQGVENRHPAEYEKLAEPIKDIDRALARFILQDRLSIQAAVREECAASIDKHLDYACDREEELVMGALVICRDEIRALTTPAERDAVAARDDKLLAPIRAPTNSTPPWRDVMTTDDQNGIGIGLMLLFALGMLLGWVMRGC